MCEQGMKHVDLVNFDQINNAGNEGVDIHWGSSQFWREIPCMEVVALMSGAQGEEAHQAYKEGNGSHWKHVWVLFWLWYVITCYSLQLFSGAYSAV